MASLAGLLQLEGHRITGSDKAAYPPMSDQLHELGIPVKEPYAAENLDPAPDLVVIGNALSRGNPEVERVLDERIPFTSMAALLQEEFLTGRESLVVAGTHGKTTTTSMLAWIYQTAARDESGAGAVVPDRRRGGEFWHELSTAAHAHVHRGGRRVRHRVLRQGAEVPALLSRRADSHPRGVRPRRHLRRSGRGEDCLQAAGEPGAAARRHRGL